MPLPTKGSPTRRRKTLGFIALALLLIVSAAAIGGGLWIRSNVYGAVEHNSAEEIISVEPGMGPNAIIAQLGRAGIVRNPLAVKVYLRLTGKGKRLKAGDYQFKSPISPLQAIEKIERAEVFYERVTIPEGFNMFDIADALARTGKATKEEFLRLMNDPSLIAKLAPQARNLEGYLFPDTYNYTSRTTADDMVRAMVERFESVFIPEWSMRASRLGMSVHQVVTLASIVEEEARIPDERPLVSSVFHNRLKLGMPLGSDPTFIYASILASDYDGNPNQPRHRRRASPYNTYIHAGLPPGPITSPGRASLEAALFPADSEYLYFVVSGTEGRHKFSHSSTEHDLAVQEYRRQQREQRELR